MRLSKNEVLLLIAITTIHIILNLQKYDIENVYGVAKGIFSKISSNFYRDRSFIELISYN
jgi:hypothetical protein